ncbi:hypothetical protein [Streptomyces nigrescens]|uniref:hypothetical protein n=1 Tax=Streptomyces nigrescens TaxID=1920 RepID=UPI0036FA8F62
MGTLAMRVTTLEHGHVRYTVRGPHVRGTFVVIPEALSGGTVLPSTVEVQFGDDAEPVDGDLSFYWTHRPDEPVIHNVRLHGWTGGIDPDNPPSGFFLGRYATCLRDNRTHRELGGGVRRRTEKLIRALVQHWAALPHRGELVVTAARRTAADLAGQEAQKAADFEAEAAELGKDRKRARDRLNAILGIGRRRSLPIRPADPAPVKMPIFDDKGESMGVVTVREVAVNQVLQGTVVYEVFGPRVQGRFTVGRDRFRPLPLPAGVRVTCGQIRSTSPYAEEQDHEPTINGVRVHGLWDEGSADGITPTTPDRIAVRARSGVRAGGSASWATERRASAIVRALALRYLARRDAAGLQLAAAKGAVRGQQVKCREQLRDLRTQQRQCVSRAAHHRSREDQYRCLLV